MRNLSFIDLAYEIISKFVDSDDIPDIQLRDILKKSFSKFRSPEIVPTIELSDFWVLELFHGPTFAFKDVALQFLGNLFEFFLQRGKYQQSITILGATSGDTGSAAIHGLRGKKNVNCFIMYPFGKITEIQERQMATIPDKNVYCLNVDGDFDDCQKIVKESFANIAFRNEVQLGAINSINWARVLAQITYYFYSWLRVTDKGQVPLINFAVPTGNFGNILAAYYAKRMGLPISKLVICTNENDVLHRFMESGIYSNEPSTLTIAPSMDISISSNFERYLFYLADENADVLASWMREFETTGKMKVSANQLAEVRKIFLSSSSSKEDIIETMLDIYIKDSYLLCPHTATSAVAVKKLGLKKSNVICLATAHPAKFEEAIMLALGKIPNRPPQLEELFPMKMRSFSIANEANSVQSFIRKNLNKTANSEFSGLSVITIATVIGVVSIILFNVSKIDKINN